MSYVANFKGWDKLDLKDLLVAYRKAKADCYFENTFPTAIKFAEYEQDLLLNLKSLLKILREKNGFKEVDELFGNFRIVPKKLEIKKRPDSEDGHIHFSDPDRAFKSLLDKNSVIPEFRIIGDFPVDAHVISALWINMIGHKFDACLDDSCYGARLKRVRNDEELDKAAGKLFHITAVGSFFPYFQPYQRWRGDGLRAIRGELDEDRNVIAVSLDLKSYYHSIDPSIISSDKFLEAIGLNGAQSLSECEKEFTGQIAWLLKTWSKKASKFSTNLASCKDAIPGGLVIGLTVARIVSNVILHRWDALIREKVTPIHYGRYIDDMFLVLRDSGTISDASQLMKFLQNRLGKDCLFRESGDSGAWVIQQGEECQGKSLIRLQPEKQKLFVLQGQAGKDLLDSIEKEIYQLSSEHRLMPSPDQLESSTAARVLSAAGNTAEQADTLRKADGLTIRRLSWSLQLRHVETLARDLPPKAWEKQRKEFYQFAHNHILRPDNLFAHYPYLPRLLGFAITLNEWAQAEAVVKRAFASIDQLAKHVISGSKIAINGMECLATEPIWQYVKGSLTWSFVDSAAKSYDPESLSSNNKSSKVSQLAKLFFQQLFQEMLNFRDVLEFDFGAGDFYSKAPLLAISDLAKKPYKKILAGGSSSVLLGKVGKKENNNIFNEFVRADLLDAAELIKFLKSSRSRRLQNIGLKDRKTESLIPYFFPTRPYTPSEIAELAPECVGMNPLLQDRPSVTWAKYVRALRGVWVKPTLLASQQDVEQSPKSGRKFSTVRIGTNRKKDVIVAITNVLTPDSAWSAAACGKPELSLDRYSRIAGLVNQAIELRPKPDYVLFPELSLPLQWVSSVANRLSGSGISLIAGTEYRHKKNDRILSEVCLELSDNRLGFPSSVRIWQPKLQPAVGEDRELTSKFGKRWFYEEKSEKPVKPVYIHDGFHFGLLVCSELQNSKERIKFQGAVDALMVLSWNQDLDTFSALIEATALDVHAFTVLVNNRKYGDSRVRSPAKESFLRDLARLRGGDNDFCVAVKLDIETLRKFQSRAKRWPESDDPFKPVPEGFRMRKTRHTLPPK
ncbi:RNA-directed DNA polymerase [Paraburkholderia aromaticivorans]|uniref:Reverse transcriptase domain-containing protein n=1 Tax=Paraburkholderia aromaticivorans TaxID=2026199 RepID=A0A248VKQ6_9BURK|nr:RNA-directed DNA polymerase [Paraburkholderia aromaticivorans]ASV98999.1 hypothetical protein CJU94_13040 [Paraburkholderia aromaticivorans]